MSIRPRLTLILASLCAVVALGCSNEATAPVKTTLRGKLTVNRKPVFTGNVTAYSGGSKVGSTNINPDGTFEIYNLPTGSYQLTVTDTETDTPYGKGVRLNSKYTDPEKSGLSVTVSGGQESPREFTLEAGK